MAQAPTVSHRRHAPPVGGEQRPALERQQVRRVPQDGRRVRLRPGTAAVVALGLAQVAVLGTLFRLVAPQAKQAAVGQLGGVRLGHGVVGGRHRHGADLPPGAPLVHGLDGQQPVGGIPGVCRRPGTAAARRGAEWGRAGRRRSNPPAPPRCVRRRWSAASSCRASARRCSSETVCEGSLPGVDLLRRVDRAEAVQPGPGRHGEGAHHDHARAQHQDPGVAVVQRRVSDDRRLRPALAAVGRADELRLAIRAGVLFPVAGEDDQQLAVRPAGDGGPGEVAPGRRQITLLQWMCAFMKRLQAPALRRPAGAAPGGAGARGRRCAASPRHRSRPGGRGCR